MVPSPIDRWIYLSLRLLSLPRLFRPSFSSFSSFPSFPSFPSFSFSFLFNYVALTDHQLLRPLSSLFFSTSLPLLLLFSLPLCPRAVSASVVALSRYSFLPDIPETRSRRTTHCQFHVVDTYTTTRPRNRSRRVQLRSLITLIDTNAEIPSFYSPTITLDI